MRIVVIHGPNLNLLGHREPEIYGTGTLTDINRSLMGLGSRLGVALVSFQSNHEGDLIDRVQAMILSEPGEAGLIINPGGYTHTSVALRDAIVAVAKPTWEVHLSDPDAREEFRRVSLIRDICIGCTKGKGAAGYLEALTELVAHIRRHEET
ncbi:MAG: type II 3-dehydroquinate dehydratase [Candidatus Krumholzibacteriia bacterium]